MTDTEPTLPGAPVDEATPRQPWHARGPWLTMALNMLLIATIFLSRNRWGAWGPGARIGDGTYSNVIAVDPTGAKAILLPIYKGRLELWDIASASRVADLCKGGDDATATFSRNGAKAILDPRDGTGLYSQDFILLDMATGRCIDGFDTFDDFEYPDGLMTTSLSPDGTMLFAAYANGPSRVWDTHSGRPITDLAPGNRRIGRSQFSLDGARLLALDFDDNLREFDPKAGTPLRSFKSERLLNHEKKHYPKTHLTMAEGTIVWAGYSALGKSIIALRGASPRWQPKICEIFSTSTGKQIADLEGSQIVVSPSGDRIVVRSLKGDEIRVYDAETAKLLFQTSAGKGSLWFKPGGRILSHLTRPGGKEHFNIDVVAGRECSTLKPGWGIDGRLVGTAGDRALVSRPLVDADFGVINIPDGRLLFSTNGYYIGQMLTEDSAVLKRDHDDANIIFRRIRPEWWWGVFWLPHLYVIAALAVTLALSGWRDLKRLNKK